MSMLDCDCKHSCKGLAIAASVIIGIITAILRFTAVITVTPAFLWVVFGIAIAFLAITLITSGAGYRESIRKCVCRILGTLLTGILGTILVSLILLAIEFVATSILGAIFAGLLLLFFSLLITSVACLIKCISGCSNNAD